MRKSLPEKVSASSTSRGHRIIGWSRSCRIRGVPMSRSLTDFGKPSGFRVTTRNRHMFPATGHRCRDRSRAVARSPAAQLRHRSPGSRAAAVVRPPAAPSYVCLPSRQVYGDRLPRGMRSGSAVGLADDADELDQGYERTVPASRSMEIPASVPTTGLRAIGPIIVGWRRLLVAVQQIIDKEHL